MTPEDRETLEKLADGVPACDTWRLAETESGRDECGNCGGTLRAHETRAALRAALVERTCGTCVEVAHVVHYYTGEDVDELIDRYRLEHADNGRYRAKREPKEGA